MIIPPEIMITKNLHPEDVKILDDFECSEKIIFRQKTSFINEVKVVENELGRFLKFEDNYQGGKINHPLYQGNIPYINYFLLALAMKNDIKNVLILGLGTGSFVNQLKSILPEVKKIDVVEINPELVEIAEKYFDYSHEVGTAIKIQDGRVFVRNCSEKYDLIILDVFSESGMAYRFMTKEFLEEINNILTPDGILASNVFGITDIDSENNIIFKSLLKTYNSVFNDSLIFPTNYGNYEFYKLLIGLKHDLSDLTNIILFSCKEEIDIKTSKVLEIMDKLNINLDKYVQDFYLDNINLENARIFLDEDENNMVFFNQFFKKYINKFNEIFDNI
jgi:spermidine synthase